MGIKNWWRGGPDIAKITKTELIENIPNSVHKAELWASKLTDEIRSGMSSAVNAVSKEVKYYDSFAGRAHEELRQAQKELIRLTKSANDADLKAKHFIELTKDFENAAQTIARENDQIRAIREIPISRITLLENTAMKAREAARKANHFTEIASREAGNLVEQKRIRDAAEESYKVAKSKHEKLLDFAHRIKTSPQDVARELAEDPSIGKEFRYLDDWFEAARSNINIKNQILNSTSRFINSSKNKFFKEYATEVYPGIKRGDKISLMWMANPQNRTRLAELSRSKKFIDKMLELEHGKEFKESLRGLTKAQIARKLKITGAAGAALAGAVAFMTWFDEEGDEIAQTSSKISGDINSFIPSGLGAVIVNDTRSAIEKINSATKELKTSLSNNPEKSAPEYVKTIIQQKAILDKNLERWDVVVRSADNKEAASAFGQSLSEYSKYLETQLNDVGKLIGSAEKPGRTVKPTEIAKSTLSRDRVKAVQNYLSERFPMVGPTGNLDKPTVRALKVLEKEYDRYGNTDRFSSGHLLVRPNEGHIIDVTDLKNLDERMKKYR